MPYAWGTTGLCYRSDLVTGTPPDGWSDLLAPDPALKGKITMLSTDRWLMGAGLKSLGYSINSTDEEEIKAARDVLIEAKKNLLAYDDTTFYSKLVSAEAHLVHAWDGWVQLRYRRERGYPVRGPQGGQRSLGRYDGRDWRRPSTRRRRTASSTTCCAPDTGKWVAENILYKVPNKAAMEALDKSLFESYPSLGMSPSDLLEQEAMRDIGRAQKAYTRAVTEITAAQ